MGSNCSWIITRTEWNARPPKNVTMLALPGPHIVLSQTAMSESLTFDVCRAEVRKIQNLHMDGGTTTGEVFDDIAMNFLICGDGTVFEGRGWAKRGAHRREWNGKSHSIYFMGDYRETSDRLPPRAALDAARRLIQCGVDSHFVEQNYTLYGSYLNAGVPVACHCGPIDRESPPWNPVTPFAASTPKPQVSMTGDTRNDKYLYGVLGGVIGFTLVCLFFMWLWKRRSGTRFLEKKVRLQCAWALIRYEIPPKHVCLVDPLAGPDKYLGKGNFGVVVKGRLVNWRVSELRTDSTLIKTATDQFVAIKFLPDHKKSEWTMNNFAQEMEMLMKVGRHVNIVNFIGVVLVGEPMIVMEYCSLGSLDKFLRNPNNNRLNGLDATFAKYEFFGRREEYRPSCCDLDSRYMVMERTPDTQIIASVDDLIHFGYQICRGMDFVFSRNMIHRDLAARNILLNSAMTVKIADFGMARDNSEYVMQSDTVELPLRWLAPESITRRGSYNIKSDVWSFGVTLWEILSLGRTPYEEELPKLYSSEQLRTFLASNGRLRQPIRACDTVYGIMQKCWAKEPTDRPLFAELTAELGQLLPPHMQQVYLKLDEENSAFNEKLDKDYYLTHL
ncbi:hypothetical protein RvY_06101 [Ramazzottius varieornatus]|uniref:Protein kinase domain-containing protein n=1 Tax=Ramazzottius varieornatus TaxID=947166 RepID=A0A1D1V673_RAMVA|nr:hypothetical protein RvY_06101 [Ramazzottius varieornatus]